LAACSTLQRTHEKQGRELPWCAFVDPSATLYAPGVSEAGVRPERLLVVRPPLEALSRTVLRLAKSPAFALVIVDALGVPGARLRVLLDAWPRLVRRLAMEVEGTERSIVLVTDRSAPRAMPLPVAQRIEITRPAQDRLLVQVPKDRHGQVTPIRPVLWTGLRRPEVEAAEGAVQHATAS
jgi:recombination protein RecA